MRSDYLPPYTELLANKAKEITSLPRPKLDPETRGRLLKHPRINANGNDASLLQATLNPSVEPGKYRSSPWLENGGSRRPSLNRRYYATVDDLADWPTELHEYNKQFAKTLETIKRRHDGVVTTIGACIPCRNAPKLHL